MGRKQVYKCDYCGKEVVNGLIPLGWMQVSFFNGKWFEYFLCGYGHLVQWGEDRESYYSNRYERNSEKIKTKESAIGEISAINHYQS